MILSGAFWLYFAGFSTLGIGLASFRQHATLETGSGIVLALGRIVFAIAIAIFGAEHFVVSGPIAGSIPHWIPGHLFWVYLVGCALLAAALSIASDIVSGLASALLGLMIFCFVLLLHVPLLQAHPNDRIMQAVMLRDLSFSACAIAFAASKARPNWPDASLKATIAARFVVAPVLLFFAVQHFKYPDFVPVVPLGLAMPQWVPMHRVLSYLVGAALFFAAVCLLFNWHGRRAATLLGALVFCVVLCVYLPILASNPKDIGTGINYFADTLMMGGALFMLATGMPATVPIAPNSMAAGGDRQRQAV